MDGGAWRATVHRVAKSQTWLSDFTFTFYGVRKCSNFILLHLLHIAVQFSQHQLLKRLSLPHCVFLPPLSKIRYPPTTKKNKVPIGAWVYFWLSILFHWSICQYHTVLMPVALEYNLKSGRLTPPAQFFFVKTALAVRGLLCFHVNCEIFCSSSVKNAIGNLIGIALNM